MEMVDFISELPDSILISMISRIKTDEAVRTSILSKRWSNLYKFVSVFNFVCYYLVDRSTYCDLDLDVDHSKAFLDVSRFLELHSGPIHSFNCLCCLTKSSAQAFEQCIYSLGNLGIEKLFLYLSCRAQQTDVSFSCHLLSYIPSLKDFDLAYCSLQPSLKVECNSLNTRRLNKIKLLPGSLECILSGCLSLYTLMIGSCQFSSSKLCFCGPNLQLKCLMIHHCEDVELIELCSSNLITLELYSRQIIDVRFNYVPQLQNIYLCLYDISVMPYVCQRLAKDLPKLKSFVYETRGDVYQDGSISMSINMFSYLKLLRLDLWCQHEINLLSLTPLLHSCPPPAGVSFGGSPLKYNGPEVEESLVPHSQLMNVDISGFGGTKNEIDFALYILKSAVRLQQMYISRVVSKYSGYGEWKMDPGPTWSEETNKTIQEQLKNQAVSGTAQVIIQPFPRIKWKSFTNYGILVD